MFFIFRFIISDTYLMVWLKVFCAVKLLNFPRRNFVLAVLKALINFLQRLVILFSCNRGRYVDSVFVFSLEAFVTRCKYE
jgi:hypothetical protein